MRSNFETIAAEQRDNHILLVTLNRPDASNAMNTQMGLDLTELFEGLSVDIEGARVVILTGSGTKAFCAGGDLKQQVYNKAISLGARDEGGPGPRSPTFYAANFRDLDGNKLCVCCHQAE